MSEWKKVELGNLWNYKELGKGAELIGVYVSKEEHVGSNNSNVYTIEGEDHKNYTVWGSTVLDVRMNRIEIGEEVKIVYLGKLPSEKRKGSNYHNFDVYHRSLPFEKVESDDISEEDKEYINKEMSG